MYLKDKEVYLEDLESVPERLRKCTWKIRIRSHLGLESVPGRYRAGSVPGRYRAGSVPGRYKVGSVPG